MPKVHKSPVKLHPAVSCINSFPTILSTWLNFTMKQLLPIFPSFIKDSTDILKESKYLYIPNGTKILTADVTAMYTIIDTMTGINAIENIFQHNEKLIPTDFPKDFFLTTLKIIMDKNTVSFSDI
jgi:hypothetical protein